MSALSAPTRGGSDVFFTVTAAGSPYHDCPLCFLAPLPCSTQNTLHFAARSFLPACCARSPSTPRAGCLPRPSVRPAGRTFLALGAIMVPANVAAVYLVYFWDSSTGWFTP